jgi:hypothetical protein
VRANWKRERVRTLAQGKERGDVPDGAATYRKCWVKSQVLTDGDRIGWRPFKGQSVVSKVVCRGPLQ